MQSLGNGCRGEPKASRPRTWPSHHYSDYGPAAATSTTLATLSLDCSASCSAPGDGSMDAASFSPALDIIADSAAAISRRSVQESRLGGPAGSSETLDASHSCNSPSGVSAGGADHQLRGSTSPVIGSSSRRRSAAQSFDCSRSSCRSGVDTRPQQSEGAAREHLHHPERSYGCEDHCLPRDRVLHPPG